MNNRMSDESQRDADVASIAEHLDAIELAAAVADGGVEPGELTDEQLRILLAEESAEIVYALLSREAQEDDEGHGSGSFVLTDYVRRWSPVIGSVAVAAAVVVVGLVGFRPSAGLDWSAPANIGILPGIKTPLPVSERPLLAFLESGDRRLIVVDSMEHDGGRGLSFGLGWIDAKNRLVPHGIVTFEREKGTAGTAFSGPAFVGRGDRVDEAWIDRLCAAGYDSFAASITDGDARWGVMGVNCGTVFVGVSDQAGMAWIRGDGAPQGDQAAPGASLTTKHTAAFKGAPFSALQLWSEE